MKFDYKHMHKSNWPVRDRQPTLLEYIAMGFLITASGAGLMLLAIYKATGGI